MVARLSAGFGNPCATALRRCCCIGIAERCAQPRASFARTADSALNAIWRKEADARAVLLRITVPSLEALGIEPNSAQTAEAPQRPPAGHTNSPASPESPSAATAQGPSGSHTSPLRGKAREGAKQAALVAMLRPEG